MVAEEKKRRLLKTRFAFCTNELREHLNMVFDVITSSIKEKLFYDLCCYQRNVVHKLKISFVLIVRKTQLVKGHFML